MKISLKTEIFKAAQHCCANKDVRYYLNGACLRLANGEKGQIHATDGHVLFVASFDVDYYEDISDCKGVFDIIIPLDAVKHAAKSKTKMVSMESLPNGEYLLNGLCFTAIDGKFPDIARVIPDKKAFSVTPAPGQFSPELLVRCHKALNAWFNFKRDAFSLYHQGPDSSAIMQGPDNSALCVIMPVRIKDAPDLPYNFTVLSDAPAK